MKLELLTFGGCPHADEARDRLRAVVDRLVPGTAVEERPVETEEEARRIGFAGSPSIRVDGRDLEDYVPDAPRLACRAYPGGGAPPEWLIEAAVLRALKPRHVLFMCVANSARSQLAEGLARALAPEDVRISSAGSEPTSPRPEALQVMAEQGLDLSHHRSKTAAEVPEPDTVDAVITLCAEEVCPTWLGRAWRLHWGLPDPAAVQGEGRLQAFRDARDELRRRLAVLFA